MGYMTLHFTCIACGQRASANPHKVPSVRMSRDAQGNAKTDPHGAAEPLCEHCARTINAKRIDAGLEPWPIDPQAYAPAAEHEG